MRLVPVAVVARPGAGRVAFLVAEMLGHLGFQGAFQDQLHQPGQQPVLPDQLQAVAAGPLDQVLGQFPVLLGRDACQLRPRLHLVLVLVGALLVHGAHG